MFVPALVATLAAPLVSLAQDVGAPPNAPAAGEEAPMEELAQKHYDDGKAAAARGDWQAAYTSFRAGYAVQPHSSMVRALGDAAYHLGKSRDAAEYLALYLQKAPASAPVGERASAQQMLADAKTRVGAIQITAPPGAEVFVDKAFVGKAPLGRDVYVEPGNCEVEARAGDQYGQQRIVAASGVTSPVKLVYGIVAPPLPTATASGLPTSTGPVAPPLPPHNPALGIAGLAVGGAAIVAGAVLLGSRATRPRRRRRPSRISRRRAAPTCAWAPLPTRSARPRSTPRRRRTCSGTRAAGSSSEAPRWAPRPGSTRSSRGRARTLLRALRAAPRARIGRRRNSRQAR
ncbi:MAG: hypothetical protein U0441_07705 [Polyangiaceae bacterium]